LSKTDKRILELLERDGPLTLAEIAERLNMKPKSVFRALRRLFEKGDISSDPRTRTYFIEENQKNNVLFNEDLTS